MLNELASYAKKYEIPTMPGFKAKKAQWVIQLSEKGKFIDILEDERTYVVCPHLEQNELIAGGISRSHFLLDTLSIVLDIDTDRKGRLKHEFFIKLLDEASEYEPLLKHCADFLRDEFSLNSARQRVKTLKAKATNYVTFRIGSINVVDLVSWHDWWNNFRSSIREKENNPPMLCLLSGNVVEPVSNHFKITGLTSVGGQASGTVLIGFDKDSYTSYGLTQSLNAACSEESAALYRNALDNLIEKAPRPLAGTMFLHWYKEPIEDKDDILLFEGIDMDEIEETSSRIRVEKLLRAIHEGERPELIRNKYYILQLSASGGRIMVRDWVCGDFSDLVTKINKWFDDLSIVNPDGKGLAGDFKLSAAFLRMVDYRPGEEIRKTFARIDHELSPIFPRMWRSILEGSPLMSLIADKALHYIKSKLFNSENDTNLDRVACALLKAWLIREEERRGGKSSMQTGLNENHTSSAYHAGRMMAVLGDLQQCALGDVGSGVVQRYYAAVSATPALVLGRLIRMAQFHLNKIESKGLANWYEKLMASIAEKMGDSIPTTMTLEEQALFALGYYQQKAAMMAGKQNTNTNSNS
ncbi:MAG TPA: type I-C CRISPR-associated protein Cas8c/Csd1 [Bacillota bacterium]|nr:type I-C CRISPR-associated protein Cas8c/Csd1 [Bacillota bacterium]HQA66135.1 type I-C CRISPR-associated protein Cas8c/Csd1 [Bacillota bacterium]HQO42963.1 type I-C CRISPR-associated protein Cas8c/Csd1 [Bacillota bacterium]HQQ43609.1 type I-C CRISPR-associated protein Cas8c/Csd1 [Bacillota bacterium]